MQRVAVLVGAIAAVLVLGAPAMADPNPDNNKNAVVIEVTCDDPTLAFEVVTIGFNAASAAQIKDGSGVVVLIDVKVYAEDGTLVYSYNVPGFDHNGQETAHCEAENQGYRQEMEVVFRPA